MKEVETYYNHSKYFLKQAEEKLKNLDPNLVANYTIKVFQSLGASKELLGCLFLSLGFLLSLLLFFTFWNVTGSRTQTCNNNEVNEKRTFSNTVHFTFCFELDLLSNSSTQSTTSSNNKRMSRK